MKPPVDFSLASALRILLPGFFVATAVSPIVDAFLNWLSATGGKVELDRTVIWGLSILVLGYAFVIADMHIYMLYEGRRYWPARLKRWMLRREERRLSALKQTIETSYVTDRLKYLEAAVEIRRFNMDAQGDYVVEFPTRLGNLLAAFEAYPNRMYGMDAVFYWPRIWIALDKDVRAEIDGQQAFADSTLYTSVALVIGGLLAGVYAVLAWAGIPWLRTGQNGLMLLALGGACFVAAFALYRGSLHLQASFGETFKSVFDLFRDRVPIDEVIREVADIVGKVDVQDLSKREKYRVAWRYLHNYRVKPDPDAESVSPGKARELRVRATEQRTGTPTRGSNWGLIISAALVALYGQVGSARRARAGPSVGGRPARSE